MEQHHYVLTSNIRRFEQHLRSGVLDAEQTRTVAALLAEAHVALDELTRHGTIKPRADRPYWPSEEPASAPSGP